MRSLACRTRDPCYTETVANLTITVDEEILKRARIRALEQGTSVNAVLAERLARYAGERDEQVAAIVRLVALGDANVAKGGPACPARRLTREELHER